LKQTLTVLFLFALTACSTTQPSNRNQPATATQPSASAAPAAPSAAAKPAGDLKEGEASGSIVDEGQTINLKYAYAGHTESFGEDAIVVLVTENPVAPDVLTKALEDSFGIFPRDNKGLEYKVGKGFWVMYHPSGFQTSGINTLKNYSVENGVVKGSDEDSTKFNDKDYKRSVSFVARVLDKK
jgi:hypothetical protein